MMRRELGVARCLVAIFALCVAVLLSMAGCTTAGFGVCPDDAQLEQNAGASVLQKRCARCHSSQLVGDARQGAPVGVDFDGLTAADADTSAIYERARNGSMPPEGALSDADVESLRIYLMCLE